MPITTKTGDKGETSMLGGVRVKKDDICIEAYGTVDELNACLGVVLLYVKDSFIKSTLEKVQNELFIVGAELSSLATNRESPSVTVSHVRDIENSLDLIEAQIPKQTAFILPRGSSAAAYLHLARTVCRKAERRVVECEEKYEVNEHILKYLNRLSDLLFLFARKENAEKEEEVSYD